MKNALMFVAVALSVLAGSIRAADESKVDDEGFIHDWLLLAPVKLASEENGAEEIDKQQIKDEGKMQPKEGEKVKVGDKELTWKKIKTTDFLFDVNEILKEVIENQAVYAVAYVVSDEEQKGLKLQMGSNDQGKVYLNGKEVVKFTATRTLEKDQDTASDVTLNKGVNTIVFKVINEKNNFQGCIRFADKASKPVKNLKVKLAP